MGQIEIIASAITKEEQLDIAKLLVKAGYTVSITKGEIVNRRSSSFINYKREELKGNDTKRIQGSGRD
ncbi:hypothetical protein AALC16_22680 [Lachnospiraceae bacterium 29-91]